MAASYMMEALEAVLPVRTRHCALLFHIVHAMQFRSSWLHRARFGPYLTTNFSRAAGHDRQSTLLYRVEASVSELTQSPFVHIR